MTTQFSTWSSSSETSACKGWLWIGSRKPASPASTVEWPAATSPTVVEAIGPRVVCTPVTRPPTTSIPVTSQPCSRSIPYASTAREIAKTKASWRAMPPRRCSVAPSTG